MKMQDAATAPVQSRPFVVNARMLLGLAAPMTLAYLSTPLLGIADMAVIGRLGDAALLGGLAVGAVIFDFVFATFNFLRSGTTGLTAQALGAGDEAEKQAILFRRAARLRPLPASRVIAGRAAPGRRRSWLMAAARPCAAATRDYFDIRILSAPFALANYAMLGWLIGLGRSGLGLALQVCSTAPISCCRSCSGWARLGHLPGVAWATVIGEVVTALARPGDRCLAAARPAAAAGSRPHCSTRRRCAGWSRSIATS